MPTDSIWSWTAIQSLGMGVGSGVGCAVAVGPPEPVAPADGVGVASATGVAVGSGIGGRLETGERVQVQLAHDNEGHAGDGQHQGQQHA